MPLTSAASEEIRVPVLLGVMSNCPDALYCERVFNDVLSQVGPLVELDVTYIARVNASEPTYGVTCRHGENECRGNVQQLCAIRSTRSSSPLNLQAMSREYDEPSWRTWWSFITCQNAGGRYAPGKEDIAKQCARSVGLPWVDVEYPGGASKLGVGSCFHNEVIARTLLLQSVERTRAMGITNSCTVFINGVKTCIRDDDKWKDCKAGKGSVDDFVKLIHKEHKRLNRKSP